MNSFWLTWNPLKASILQFLVAELNKEKPSKAQYIEIYGELGIRKEFLQFIGQSNIPIRFRFKVINTGKKCSTFPICKEVFLADLPFGYRSADEIIRLLTV